MAEVSVTFRSISRLKFHQIRARIRAQAEAMSYDENSGCAWDSWMEIQWLYEEGDQKLTITCTKRPIWRTEGWAESKIRGLVEAL